MTQPLLQAADLRDAAHLTRDALAGLADLVEAMQALPGIPGAGGRSDERIGAVAGLVGEAGGRMTDLAGASVDALLGWLTPALAAADAHQPQRPEREAILAALNGVLGDHLATADNPLAIMMQFRHSGRPLPLQRHALRTRLRDATPQLMVLVHGLCMNDLQWSRAGHDHGEALARELGYTPIYLHYNSGLSVSTNGRILAQLMEGLYSAWPVPVERLVLLGHGMGGLVARSAIHHGAQLQRGGLRWPVRVNDLVCLGTPHQGAPLERAGHGVDRLLGAAPCAAPLARLAKLRSAGIHDLQLGNVLKGSAGDDGATRAASVHLPDGARCFAIAACLATAAGNPKASLRGDGVVPVASALGEHHEPALGLGFATERKAVVYGTDHLDLLASTEVYGLLRRWLS